jgi:hypothetical protein
MEPGGRLEGHARAHGRPEKAEQVVGRGEGVLGHPTVRHLGAGAVPGDDRERGPRIAGERQLDEGGQAAGQPGQRGLGRVRGLRP